MCGGATWNERIAGENLEDLDAAAGLFERLAALDVFDAAAWYNRALCLAWAGKNADAIELVRVVDLEATAASEDAVTAWMLAEVLRQGGGAETLADDLRFAFTIGWDPGDTQATLLREFPEIRKVPTPRAPRCRGG